MKAKDLKKIVGYLAKFRSNTLAITDTILFENGEMSGTNLQDALYFKTGWNAEGTIDYADFKKFVTALDANDEVEVINGKDGYLFVKLNGKIEAKFLSQDLKDYPRMTKPTDKSFMVHTHMINGNDANKILDALDFTSDDQLRPSMTGVLLSEEVVATDGHILYFKKLESNIFPDILSHVSQKIKWEEVNDKKQELGRDLTPEEMESMTIYTPVSFEGCLIRDYVLKSAISISKEFDIVAFTENNLALHEKTSLYTMAGTKFALIKGEGFELITRMIDEKYPDYKNVVPDYSSENHLEVIVSVKDLIKSTKLALSVANATTKQIKFAFQFKGAEVEGGFRLIAEDLDKCKEFNRLITCNRESVHVITEQKVVMESGEEAMEPVNPLDWFEAIGFNGAFLLKILDKLNTDYACFQLRAANRSALINKNFLLMPVMLNNYN